MPSERFRLFGRPRVPPSTPPNGPTSPGSVFVSPSALPNPPAPQPPAPRRAYPDHVNDGAVRLGLNAALDIASILNDIPDLPQTIASPLTHVMDVMSEMMSAVKLLRKKKYECTRLVTRVVKFLQSLVDEWKTNNVPIVDGTPIAVKLIALKRSVTPPSSSVLCAKMQLFPW